MGEFDVLHKFAFQIVCACVIISATYLENIAKQITFVYVLTCFVCRTNPVQKCILHVKAYLVLLALQYFSQLNSQPDIWAHVYQTSTVKN